MDFLPTLLLILASNLDTLALGFAYAAKGIRIPLKKQFFIAAMAAGFTFLALLIGQGALRLLPHAAVSFFERHSNKIFGGVLLFLGIIQILQG